MSRLLRLSTASLFAAVLVTGLPGLGADPQTGARAAELTAKILQARDKLQEGWNTWNAETMKAGRDQFINLIIQGDGKNADLYYYAGLSEYRLAVYAYSSGRTDEAASAIGQAKKYLEKLMDIRPDWGEPYALYGTLLGFEIALNPDLGMELGMKTLSYFGQAESKEPRNPRVRLLKGSSLFYWPVEFGGGADNALRVLAEAVDLFEKDKPGDPLKPAWGLEEALTFMARAFSQKGEKEKALDCLKRALIANPNYGLARQELNALQKDK
ncbi:MAG: hypothetical protein A2Y69_02470 [Candidatus Aminicenantes bacterium RBG_13_59_9]|nr:MAG: hypothetical protein A2Y69_02470 [Candidatus Aminicenantes bacterium RBG_13_59_9]